MFLPASRGKMLRAMNHEKNSNKNFKNLYFPISGIGELSQIVYLVILSTHYESNFVGPVA